MNKNIEKHIKLSNFTKITTTLLMLGLLSGCIDEFKEKISGIINTKSDGEQNKEEIIYNIDPKKEKDYVKIKKGELVYVLYKTKDGEQVLLKRPFVDVFLEGEIYEFKTNKGDEDIIFIALDRLEKKELPQKYIINGAKINILNGGTIGKGESGGTIGKGESGKKGFGEFIDKTYNKK